MVPQPRGGVTPLVLLANASLLLSFHQLNTCHAWSLSSYLSGDDDADGSASASSKRKTRLPKIISRNLETSVSAADWPTTALSPLCEGWAFLDAGSSGGQNDDGDDSDDDKSGSGNACGDKYDQWKWGYLDAIASGIGQTTLSLNDKNIANWSYQDSVDLAIHSAAVGKPGNAVSSADTVRDVAQSLEDSFEGRILRYNLALRSFSPLCELHRTLARDAAIESGLYDPYGSKATSLPSAFAVIYPSGEVGVNADEIIEAYRKSTSSNDSDADSDKETPLLPGECTRSGDSNSAEVVVVLYGQFGSDNFSRLYSSLSSNDVPFTVRHMGIIDFEEQGGNSLTGIAAGKTALQGYGVRLDIRNLEYKVFDDKADADAEEDDENADNEGSAAFRSEFLAGFNVSRMVDRAGLDVDQNSTRDMLSSMQGALIESDHFQSFKAQTVPPQWQRRDLPLQAAHVVSSAADPLWALQDVSQNLPNHASTLVELSVPDEIRIAAEIAKEMPVVASVVGEQGPFALLVNGRKIDVQRPSFNLFQLMKTLRQEDAILAELEDTLGKYIGSEGLNAVQNMIEMGEASLDKVGRKDGAKKSSEENEVDMFGNEYEEEDEEDTASSSKFRIDVGRGYRGAVTYMNDIEKDQQYSRWPSSISEMMMMMQYGGQPIVRRNLYTILIVVDPLSDQRTPALDMAIHFIQNSMPVRLGFLFVSDSDIDKCNESKDSECSIPPLNIDDAVDLSDVKNIKATTKAMSMLTDDLIRQHGGMAALGFVHMVCQAWNGRSSLKDLIEMYVEFITQAGINQGDAIVESALMALGKDTSRDPNDKKSTAVDYAMSINFAIKKSLRPGMAFLNGIPLPSEPQEMQKVFYNEQNHIIGLAMTGKISDSGPRSIYGFLLTGDNVFPRNHRLLTESKGRYVSIAHRFGSQSLRFPESHVKAAVSASTKDDASIAAPFLLESFVDLESREGQSMALSFIRAMESLSQTQGEGKDADFTSVAYRILPSNPPGSGASLANILSKAGEFDTTTLTALLNAYVDGDNVDDLESVVLSLSEVPKQSKSALIAAATSGTQDDASSELEGLPAKNFITANGRVFVPEDGDSITVKDIEILLSLSMTRSRAVARLMRKELEGNDILHDTVAKASSFVGTHLSSSDSEKRVDVSSLQNQDDKTRLLYYSWNDEINSVSSPGGRRLEVKVTAILDPLSEATQRVAPLLRAIRDQLKLPLTLMLAPRPVVSGDAMPVSSYYRFVADPQASPDQMKPTASFENLPTNHVLTIRMDVPEPWNVQQDYAIQDTDNLRCDVKAGCSDEAYSGDVGTGDMRIGRTVIEYGLRSLLFFGQCYDVSEGSPPNGLQLTIDQTSHSNLQLLSNGGSVSEIEIQADGTLVTPDDSSRITLSSSSKYHTDTLVMKTVGYWQLRAKPGVFKLAIQEDSRGAEIYEMVEGKVLPGGRVVIDKNSSVSASRNIVMKDFIGNSEFLLVKRREGYETAELYSEDDDEGGEDDDTVHVFSLATGHLYERFLKIMMLSVTKRTSSKVKFWLFENFLSPSFKATATAMAEKIGCEVDFVTYKWPEWLRGQSEKQRIIWGYKILFLDVLFPLNVKKIIYVDADQVVRGDMKELVELDLNGAPYGYTPMCSSREETRGYAFWNQGFWKSHLRDKPYHISALYVVDLARFRREMVGDKLRSYYQSLTADPNSLANLDQDLPNYAQHDVPIFSLPQEWLWCESWCSDETKATAKTIDLCNNPMHKEPKVSMAKRVISGVLFEESWIELDAEVEKYDEEYLASVQ